MEVCRNKMSGKYFIVVKDYDDGSALMVNPLGRVAAFKKNLFKYHEETNERYLIDSGNVTQTMVEKYHVTQQHIDRELSDFIEELIEDMTPEDKKRLYRLLTSTP